MVRMVAGVTLHDPVAAAFLAASPMAELGVEGSSSEWSQASIEGEEHEEVTEISEEELLQILDGQEPPLQERCVVLF